MSRCSPWRVTNWFGSLLGEKIGAQHLEIGAEAVYLLKEKD